VVLLKFIVITEKKKKNAELSIQYSAWILHFWLNMGEFCLRA